MRRSPSSAFPSTPARHSRETARAQAAGPAAARLRSWEQFDYGSPEGGASGWYDVEADREYLAGVTMADVGDVTIQGSDVEQNFHRMTETVRRIVERGSLPVAVGGDHSISYPLGRSLEAVSIDLDVLDLSIVPGTTLPEPGGPGYRQVREALAEVARRGRVVGFDIAELNPPYDPSGTPRVSRPC